MSVLSCPKYLFSKFHRSLPDPVYHVLFLLSVALHAGERSRMRMLKNKKPTRCHLLLYFASYRLNMFRALLRPSSGARYCNVDYHIGYFILGLLCVGG